MSELSVRVPGNVAGGISASGLLLSCSAMLLSSLASHSHPLFSYLVKLVSFLGPLFFTTFLVLLSLLTLSPCFVRGGSSEPRLSSLMGVCSSILNKFRTNANEGNGRFFVSEDSEVYRIIFDAPELESGLYGSGGEESDPPVDKFLIYGDDDVWNTSSPSEREIARPDVEQGKKLGALFMEKLWCETECSEETEVEGKVKAEDENSNKVVDEEKQIFHDSESGLRKGSEAKIDGDVKNNHHDTIFSRRRQGSRRFGESSSRAYENVPSGREIDRNMGSFGSMSGSKEWKRTLACKLFEERHNAEGEGMDSLWETYEDESSKKDAAKTSKKTKIKVWKKERVDSKGSNSSSSNKVTAVLGHGDVDEGDEDEAAGMDDKFCCLQALRLSAGRKMGLGMGRPNIVRISKAFGWLHHHHVSHGKKG